MKKILGVFVAFLILVISSSVYQVTKVLLERSNLGESLYNSMGAAGVFIEVVISMSPLIIGIWLVRVSWRKITYKTVDNISQN